MKKNLVLFFVIFIIHIFAQEIDLRTPFHAVDVAFVGNTTLWLVESDKGSYVIDTGRIENINYYDIRASSGSKRFIKVKDNLNAIYFTSGNGYTSIHWTNFKNNSTSENKLEISGNFNSDCALELANDECWLSGITWEGGAFDFEKSRHSLFLIKSDLFGKVLSKKIFNEYDIESVNDMCFDNENNIYLYTTLYTKRKGKFDFAIFKFSQNGEKLWSKILPEKDYLYGGKMLITSENQIAINGTLISGKDKTDLVVLKLNSNAEILWEKTFNGAEKDRAIDILPWKENQIVSVSELTFGMPNYDKSIELILIDKSGNEVRKLTDCEMGHKMTPYSAKIDNYGNVIVVGEKMEKSSYKSSASETKFSAKDINGEEKFFWE